MPGHTEESNAKRNSRSGVDRRAVKRSAVDRRRVRNGICGALLAVVLVGTATVYGCNSDRIAGPSASPTSAAPAADLVLPPGNSSGSEPYATVEEACNGEFVLGSGKQANDFWFDATSGFHMRFARHYTFDGNGYTNYDPTLGTSGVSAPTGNSYHGSGDFTDDVYVQADGFPYEQTTVDIVTIKSQTDPSGNYRRKVLFHVTWSKPTAVPTATFDKGGTSCDPPLVP
jgi:hypothetical protein